LYEITPTPESEELEILLLKMFQSVEVRHPKTDPDAVEHVTVFPSLESPVLNVSALSKSVPAIAETTDPLLVVLSRLEVIEEMARAVVVAFVVVELVNRAVPAVVAPIVTFSTVPPSTFCATKAAGTAPKIFRGAISPSHVGLPVDPPTSMPRYSV
jgi:hypothetical protein